MMLQITQIELKTGLRRSKKKRRGKKYDRTKMKQRVNGKRIKEERSSVSREVGHFIINGSPN